MTCIERRPRCDEVVAKSTPDPLTKIASIATAVFSLAGSIGSAVGWAVGHPVPAAVLAIIAASSLSLLAVVIVCMYAWDTCHEHDGMPECVMGVASHIVPAFSDPVIWIAPYMAVHDRVDVTVRSKYWDVVESGSAFVFCSREEMPRRSEILRCYFKSDRVCKVDTAAVVGAIVGLIVGLIIAAVIVVVVVAIVAALVALGVVTCIGSWGTLCIVAIIAALCVAAIVAAAAVLIGAAVAGLIVMVATQRTPASDSSGTAVTVGSFITVHGNMMRRDGRLLSLDSDKGANVFWWVSASSLSGMVASGTPDNPFSYCDIEDAFQGNPAVDTCPSV